MPVDWVIAPHDRALDGVEAGLHQRSGAVLLGPEGVGKTSLARSAAEWLGPEFRRVVHVTGTESNSAVPFGAVADLIEVPGAHRTADVMRAAREALGTELLLVVDDAHLLDRLSAALVYQLTASGAAKLIATATVDRPVPEEVSALWDEGLLARIEVEPAGYDSARLAEQVAAFIADLPPEDIEVLQHLAVQDPLPLADMTALTSADTVQRACAAGAVVVEENGAQPMVHCRHVLFLNAVRANVGGPGLRRLRTAVVEQMAKTPRRGVVDRLRLAVLALDSDVPMPTDDLVAAAAEALRLGDLELSERLCRAALRTDGGFEARLTLAYALGWQGRGREADEVLAQIDPAALDENALMAWALPRAANQFWMLSEPERAVAFLRTTRNRVGSPHAQITLDALLATFTMNSGTPRRALELAVQVLDSPDADDTAVGWAASTAALSSARIGRFADVDTFAQRAIDAGHPGLLRFTSGFGQTTSRLLGGSLDEAEQLARRLTDFAQLLQPGRAIGEVLLADILIVRGQLDEAIALLRRATATLAPTGYSWGPLAWMLLAQALGQRGMPVEAGKALSRAESRHGLKSMLFAPELSLARAWTCSARKDPVSAIGAAREAAKAAERGGQTAVALRALHDAVRLGDTRAGDALGRMELTCAFGDLTRAHAAALATGDSAAMHEVAERYRDLGMNAAADDAARQGDG
ncbi:ATP-binding protein [Mycolicibacterium goodii]|uniref:ATPase AAA n=1 Tax=Mycolicibacterium goodii TaxID=134601 RepID=A0A0K0X6D8_MYCGD|nr:ATPase AAA [Mycolicibacterium goodii]